MTQAEKNVLTAMVQVLQTQMVKIDALEGALIQRRLLQDGERDRIEPNYFVAAIADLAQVRAAIANLPTEA
jgi:hypothetical protein